MKYLLIHFIMLFSICLTGYGRIHAAALQTDSSMTKKELCRELSCLEDRERKFTIKDVSGMEREAFLPLTDRKECSLGYTDSAYWFRIDLENREDGFYRWLLKIEYPLIDYISFYYPDGGGWHEIKTGDMLPFKERPLKVRTFVFPVESPAGKSSCYLRMESVGVMHFAMTAFSEPAFASYAKKEAMILWLYYGVMLALFFYNLVVFVSSRDMSYFYLILFIPAISLYSMLQNGIAFQYLWPESVTLAHAAVPFTVFFSCVMILLFTRRFLGTAVLIPRLDKLIVLYSGILIVLSVSVTFIKYGIMTRLALLAVAVTAAILMSVCLFALFRKKRQAIFFVISWIFFLIASFFIGNSLVGFSTDNILTGWGTSFGASIFVLLLSLGIADSINKIRREREDALKALQKSDGKLRIQYDRIEKQYQQLESLNNDLNMAQDELVSATEKATQEKEILSAILRSIADSVIGCDREGTVILINRIAEELTGYTQEEALGKNINEIIDIDNPRVLELLFTNIDSIDGVDPLDSMGVPFVVKDRKGAERIVEIISSAIVNDKDEKQGIVLALREITKKIEIEKEINRISKMESLGLLAGGIAHEFNNILTGIIGNISMAKPLAENDDALCRIFAEVEEAGKKASGLSQQLLTFSRGGDPVKKISDMTEIVRESAESALSGMPYSLDVENNIWPVEVDRQQMRHALGNIFKHIMNSDGSDNSSVNIKINNVSDLPDNLLLEKGEYVCVRIAYGGETMGMENIKKLFDPYANMYKSGEGLGMASSFSIVKRHGGYIDVSSGDVTAFSVYIRKSAEAMVNEKKPEDEDVPDRQGRVLLMDDEEYILDVTEKMLSFMGYAVIKTRDGEEAIKEYRRGLDEDSPFDFVITDLTIHGGMGGRETMERLKELDPSVKGIVSSGYSDDTVMANHRQYGFMGVLLKPYRLQDIERVVKDILS